MTWKLGSYDDSIRTAISLPTLITYQDMEELSIGMLLEATLVMGLTMYLTHWLLKPVLEGIFAMVSSNNM